MDERIWTDHPLAPGEEIALDGCRLRHAAPGAQSLVSGDLDAALARLAPGAEPLGFGDVPTGAHCAIRVARDRLLLVSGAAPEEPPGWTDAGFALSTGGVFFLPLTLRGPGAWEILARGLASDPPLGSPSAAVLFAQTLALVTGLEDGLTLWVEPARLTYLGGFLDHVGRTG